MEKRKEVEEKKGRIGGWKIGMSRKREGMRKERIGN